MEWIRRMICFIAGFMAAACLLVMDDVMAANYGYESPWAEKKSIRKAAFYVETALCEARRMGEFYGVYFQALADSVKEEWSTKKEAQEKETLEVFHPRKL